MVCYWVILRFLSRYKVRKVIKNCKRQLTGEGKKEKTAPEHSRIRRTCSERQERILLVNRKTLAGCCAS